MASNSSDNRYRLIQTFLKRNRRTDTRPAKSTATGAYGTALPSEKQRQFRPAKRITRPRY